MSIEKYWYRPSIHPLLIPLLPFSCAYGWITGLRRWAYRAGLKKSQKFPIPVIVVGNITVGGTGKTPLTAWLANCLIQAGRKPGIALRGVGGKSHHQPLLVSADSDPLQLGDEAVLLAKNLSCPVVTCIDRPAAVQMLIEAGCDLVLTDDGLQHYRLARQMEIAVIDGCRYFGNGRLLPAGPLRELPQRLKEVDMIVVNNPDKTSATLSDDLHAFDMQLRCDKLLALETPGQALDPSQLAGQKVHALAGIGNPQRFFDLLKSFHLEIIPHIFPDHYAYKTKDLDFGDQLPILMTEKDAIKCKRLALNAEIKGRSWFLPVTAEISPGFKEKFLDLLRSIKT